MEGSKAKEKQRGEHRKPSDKMPICRYYAAGKCKFGEGGQNSHGQCKFQHPPECQKEGCDDWKTCKEMHPAPICRFYLEGKCARQNCFFKHPSSELKPMAVKKAYESKASQEEGYSAAAKSEVTQLQLRATKELELELRAKQDHGKTVAKAAEAEERAIQEKFLVSKTSVIPD